MATFHLYLFKQRTPLNVEGWDVAEVRRNEDRELDPRGRSSGSAHHLTIESKHIGTAAQAAFQYAPRVYANGREVRRT